MVLSLAGVALMNVRHCCQMAQLVAEEMEFGQGWNSPFHTVFNLTLSIYPKGQNAFSFFVWL